ncbi:hypothetical protein HK097_007269 [Rhizophlyctis rosea]|uniref:Beta-xylanase n=1 Tax=Rhizophlyctis rosea TaxID=64517 RepID=A0AAD5SEX3_9FUNG|nr:hypothetical protein HK097_007269 [Rhizophlyctis rosea]
MLVSSTAAALALSLVGSASAAASYQYFRDAAANTNKTGSPFLVGSAIYPDCYNDWNCAQFMRGHMNVLVAENDCKFYAVHPSKDVYNFAACDKVVDVATKNNQLFRGHNVLWKDVNYSPWLANLDVPTLNATFYDHIEKVLTHYKSKAFAWDVVNEAVDDSSTADNPILRTDWVWYQTGADWVERAFRHARSVDPSAKLFYNDYNIENTNAKADAVLKFITDLKSRGVPIDGVGMQMHVQTNWYPSASRLAQLFTAYQNIGVEVHITELDIKCIAPCDLNAQGVAARTIVQACAEHDNCKALLTWGITDKYTWIDSTSKPLLLNETYGAKPFFTEMLAALNSVAVPGGAVSTLEPLPKPAPVVSGSAGPNDLPVAQGSGLSSGWQNWSWGTSADLNFAGPPSAPVGASVIKAEMTNYGGLSFKGAIFGNNGYETIYFRVAAPVKPNASIRVEDTVSGVNSALTPLSTACQGDITVDSWANCKLDLAGLGTSAWNRISFMSHTTTAQTIYVADVFVKKIAPVTTTTTTTVAPTPTCQAVTSTVTSVSTSVVPTTITSVSTSVVPTTVTEVSTSFVPTTITSISRTTLTQTSTSTSTVTATVTATPTPRTPGLGLGVCL